ncbi:MAG TPA: PIN domain-containing protein [Patescibacteria group bacterium]|nr:PIN domain-containing protein [Patescibacteria group bacterium]
MKPVILDSSALFSLASMADTNHHQAVKISTSLAKNNRSLILPTEVFAELLNIAGKKGGREMQKILFAELMTSTQIILPKTTKKLLTLAYEKLTKLPASVSYTDSLVMVYADEYETQEIFGFDEIFLKNNYKLP